MNSNTIIEMLRLCPRDNLGQRDWLGSILVRLGRYADALSFAQIWVAASEHGDTPPRGRTTFPLPSQDLLPRDRAKSLAELGPGGILHTAAIASFKLFGDCPQSREFLSIAAKAQPNVLLKVLALVARPCEWSSSFPPFICGADGNDDSEFEHGGTNHERAGGRSGLFVARPRFVDGARRVELGEREPGCHGGRTADV